MSATRWRIPAESCAGYRFSNPASPNSTKSCRARASASCKSSPAISGPSSAFFERRAPGQEQVLLVHISDMGSGMRHRSPVKINLSRIWREQPSDDVQEGGLAAAAGANEGDNLPMLDF
jgi:hypothetical protein